ncbi:hypothetical protein [Bradyrhizobium erythrophlei]|uniref:Response regulator receiver domain-containing protein n=1 Tax=Bradyrhizobium erythrophlei TaxID=1437360 RepID=A0A1H4SFJ8_9BRAD|nr:hypothetical protein [Bradyrhizobium erythrophlei]SEC42814.1 hypothetical protein SAMN05444164_1814 [Bradyrhizobium erythrophlei]
MRLDFNVLWVDDQPGAIQAQIARIARYMAEQGFHFNPALCHTMDALEGKLNEDVFVDEVDMVLVDWDLGADAKGQDAIERIREKIRYKDVVFYSAQTTPTELMNLVRVHDLEGVYCCTRTDLVNEVEGVFDSLIKKVLDLDHTRGIVMGATSDVDHMVNESLATIHASLGDDAKKQFIATALAAVEKKLKELTKLGEKLKTETDIAAFYKAHMLFTSMERLKLLKGALKTGGSHENPGAHASVVKYMDEVVPERNNLGHVVLVPEGKPTLVVNAEGKQVSLEDMRDLRCTILEVRAEFRSLLTTLRG